jgi:hypothetical protein
MSADTAAGLVLPMPQDEQNEAQAATQTSALIADTAAGLVLPMPQDEQNEAQAATQASALISSSAGFSDLTVNTNHGGNQEQPAVAMDAAGDFVVAWADDSTGNVLVRGFNADGSERFHDLTVNSIASGQQRNPAVASDATGNFVVTWEDDSDGNGFFEILARGFNADGSERFHDLTVNSIASGQQLQPAVAMDPAGNFVVAWADDSDKNDIFDILARKLGRNVDGVLNDAVSTSDTLHDLGVDKIPTAIAQALSEHISWQWIDRENPYRSITGIVTSSDVSSEDFPITHLSHDQNFHVLVDAGQEGLISVANDSPVDSRGQRREIEVEWETGISPSETHGDGTAGFLSGPIFPKWVWPSVGDRVWVNGNWIYDIAHDVDGRFRSEIHPPRAIAVMRDQIVPLQASAGVPVEVKATDLYIHGDGGLATSVLALNDRHVGDPRRPLTVLNDIHENFEFDIPLPARPANSAFDTPFIEISDGPGNTVDIPLRAEVDPSGTSVHVTVPLAGHGISSADVYARRILVGWPSPPANLHHVQLTLDSMLVRKELAVHGTFFWFNLSSASQHEWIRLSDHTTQNMDDVEDGSTIRFSDTTFDYYTSAVGAIELAMGDPVPRGFITIPMSANGYDQGDIEKFFGSTHLGPFGDDAILAGGVVGFVFGGVFFGPLGTALFGPVLGAAAVVGFDALELNDSNDPFGDFPSTAPVLAPFSTQPSTFTVSNKGDEYRLNFTVQEIPLTEQERQHPPVVLNIAGNLGSDDVVTLMRDSTDSSLLNVSINSSLVGGGSITRSESVPLSAVQAININTLDGNDKLIVNSSNGLITLPGTLGLPGLIHFDGGGGTDTILFEQTGGDKQTENSYSFGSGYQTDVSSILGPSGRQVVIFDNVESISDLVRSDRLLVNGLPTANTFTLTPATAPGTILAGEPVGLFHPFRVDAFKKIAVSDQPPLEFADKDALAIIGTGAEGDKFKLIALAGVPIQVDGGTITIDGPREGTGLDVLSVDGEGLNYRVTSSSVTEVTGQRKAVDYVRIEDLGLSSGTFAVSGDVSPNVTVNEAATLQGDGTVAGALVVNAGGTVAPGLSPGILATGSVSFSPGSTFSVELNGTAAGTEHDQLAVTGAVDLGGATLVTTLGYTPAAGDRLVILANDDTDRITGIFNGLPEGAALDVDGRPFRISYQGGDGNDVVLIAGRTAVAAADPALLAPPKG